MQTLSRTRRLVAGCVATLLALAPAAQAQPSINGGSTWTGWTSVGQSNQLGVFGSGSTTDVYEIYRSVFTFNNNAVSGGATGGGPTGGATGFGTGAFSTGAFANGNTILGVGVRRVSGATLPLTATVKFDLDNDSYQAASSVGGADGRVSFTDWSETRDFTVQFEGANGWRGGTLTMQAGNGTSNGGTSNAQWVVGGIGSGVSYDWPFRAFGQSDSYQMFFDLNAMQAIYGLANPNPFNQNVNFTGIGTFAPQVQIAINGLGSNVATFSAPTTVSTVPEPASALLVGAGLLGCAIAARRRRPIA
jgi:hypothetical protein